MTAAGAATLAPVRPARRGGAIGPVAWKPEESLDVREWVQAGQRLGAMTRCSQWWLGDWVRYGTSRWGEKYKEAARITGYDIQSLRNFAYVAGSVEVSRRRDDLAWSHHAEVSALVPAEQDRWLDFAASERMSVADLRSELRAERRRKNDSAAPRDSADEVEDTVTCPQCEHKFRVPGS